jgi:hypothetical protein
MDVVRADARRRGTAQQSALGARRLGNLQIPVELQIFPKRRTPIPKAQNVNFTESCICREPTPARKPEKSKSGGALTVLMLFSLLKVLNISRVGISA